MTLQRQRPGSANPRAAKNNVEALSDSHPNIARTQRERPQAKLRGRAALTIQSKRGLEVLHFVMRTLGLCKFGHRIITLWALGASDVGCTHRISSYLVIGAGAMRSVPSWLLGHPTAEWWMSMSAHLQAQAQHISIRQQPRALHRGVGRTIGTGGCTYLRKPDARTARRCELATNGHFAALLRAAVRTRGATRLNAAGPRRLGHVAMVLRVRARRPTGLAAEFRVAVPIRPHAGFTPHCARRSRGAR